MENLFPSVCTHRFTFHAFHIEVVFSSILIEMAQSVPFVQKKNIEVVCLCILERESNKETPTFVRKIVNVPAREINQWVKKTDMFCSFFGGQVLSTKQQYNALLAD